jgi:hypothetical protein
MIENKEDLEIEFKKCSELLISNNINEMLEKIIEISESPFSKGTSDFKLFVIDILWNKPFLMLMLVHAWNKKHPGKMIPNSIRRAFKYLLESHFSYDELNDLGVFNGISIKNIIKISRPKPYPMKLDIVKAREFYDKGITIYKSDMLFNKHILNIEFEELGTGTFYHFECFVMLLEK